MLAEFPMWSPQHVSAAGDENTQNMSLFSIRIELSIVRSFLKGSDTKIFFRQEKDFVRWLRWIMKEGLLGRFSLAKEQTDRLEGGTRDDKC